MGNCSTGNSHLIGNLESTMEDYEEQFVKSEDELLGEKLKLFQNKNNTFKLAFKKIFVTKEQYQ